MNSLIGFSTGSIWRWMKTNNRNELIDYLKSLDLPAIELAIGSKEELYSFRLSDENISWLQKLAHVSIHAPAFHKTAENPDELKKQLKIIENLVSFTGACTVVIHIEDIPSADVLKTVDFPVSIENTGPDNYTSPGKLADIFTLFPEFKFCLDLSHAALISEQETEILISRFGSRISHIHLSGTYKNSDHQSLIGASESFYRSVIPSFNLNVPFLIEEDIEKREINYLCRELETAHKLINSD